MSTPPAGWYPTGDGGDMRYWDGSRWTEHTHPGPSSGVAGAATSGPTTQDTTSPTPGPRLFPGAGWFGWGGLLLVAALGAAGSGLSGAGILSGLFVAVVAVVALVRGRVGWAHLRGRAAGGAALGTAVALFAVGGATADPQPAAAPQAGPTTPTTSPSAAAAPATPTTAPAPSSTPSTPPAPTTTPPAVKPAARAAAKGTALAAAQALPVKGRAAKTGYDRDLFGQAWFDADRNGCDTRNDILRRDLTKKSMINWCKVASGVLAPDPYTGAPVRFVYGGPSEVDIDHVVALGDAWQKGAAAWPAGKRLAFANDPVNLLAVDAGANRAKGDGDTATWLPANKAYRCPYVARQVTVKRKYHVWVTAAEQAAMVRVLSTCPTLPLPAAGPAPTIAQLPKTRTTHRPAPPPAPTATPAKPRPALKPQPKPKPPVAVYYQNCDAVRAAGAAPLYAGQPGYAPKLDRDRDGVACENLAPLAPDERAGGDPGAGAGGSGGEGLYALQV